MAFASSRIGAQEALIKTCDLCEDDENVNWFCKDCIQNLCERCKKGHLKIATCKNHRLVSILEGVAITKKNVSNQCQDHNEPFSFFCRKCDKNICSKCLSLIHKKHDFIDIHELQSELQYKLDGVLKKKEGEKLQMKSNLNTLLEQEKQIGKSLKANCATIDERRKVVESAVAEECEEMKKSMKAKTDRRLKMTKENKRKLQEKQNLFEDQIQAVRQELPLQTTSTINEFVRLSMRNMKSLTSVSFPNVRNYTFTPGSINKELIRDMIGSYEDKEVAKQLQKADNNGDSVRTDLEIVSMHELDLQVDCYSLCTSPTGGVWLYGEEYVFKMSSDCSTIRRKIPARKSFECGYIACLRSGDAVVTYGALSYVDRFTLDGRALDFTFLLASDWKKDDALTNITERSTDDVVVTYDDKVVVAVDVEDEDGDAKTMSSLLIFSKLGKQLKEVKLDKRITGFCIDNNGDFVISERKSFCLTTMDCSGNIMRTIRITKSKLQRMICDKYGNILGISKDDKEICLISKDGRIQLSHTIKCEIGINDISIDHKNRLMILVDYKNVVFANYLK